MLGLVIFIAAVCVVLLTSLFKNVNWTARTKNLIASVFSVAAAGISVWLLHGGNFNDVGDFFQLAVSTYGASQLFYNFILNGTVVESALATAPLPHKKNTTKSESEV